MDVSVLHCIYTPLLPEDVMPTQKTVGNARLSREPTGDVTEGYERLRKKAELQLGATEGNGSAMGRPRGATERSGRQDTEPTHWAIRGSNMGGAYADHRF